MNFYIILGLLLFAIGLTLIIISLTKEQELNLLIPGIIMFVISLIMLEIMIYKSFYKKHGSYKTAGLIGLLGLPTMFI